MKRVNFVWMLLVALSLIMSACQPAVETIEVEKEVVKTQVVEKVVEVEKEPSEEASFSTPHPILSDVRVRQAMAYCTNKDEIIQAVYPFLSPEERAELVMDTFIPKNHWAYAGDENVTIYPYDPEKGKALLDEAGWTDEDGDNVRLNAEGEPLMLELVLTEAPHRKILAPVWQQQMKACGIRVIVNHVPSTWLYGDTTGLARREFELTDYAWVGQSDPSGRTLYACDQIPTAENNWEGQNIMGWCNPVASQAIVKATNTINQEDRKEPYKIVQQEFTKDMVSLPLYNHLEIFASNPNLK
ncbi:MAG: ABC transporter substrate-binding protein, partial [Bellilinea sp.]|nr:ABC transporter substrate-binding protein [Bellilinea sp.]